MSDFFEKVAQAVLLGLITTLYLHVNPILDAGITGITDNLPLVLAISVLRHGLLIGLLFGLTMWFTTSTPASNLGAGLKDAGLKLGAGLIGIAVALTVEFPPGVVLVLLGLLVTLILAIIWMRLSRRRASGDARCEGA